MLVNGLVDLTKDRRPVGYDLDIEEAIEWIKRRDPAATEVTVVELDGYPIRRRI